MNKLYRILLLLIVLIFLSTFNPKEFNLAKKKNNTLFKIENIEIKGNFLINKSKIEEKLSTIRKENIFFINLTLFDQKIIYNFNILYFKKFFIFF